MEHYEANQLVMKENMDSMQEKMDKLAETVLILAQKIYSLTPATVAGNVTLDNTPVEPIIATTLLKISVVNLGHQDTSNANAEHDSHFDEEDPRYAFFAPSLKAIPEAMPREDKTDERFKVLEETLIAMTMHHAPSLEGFDMWHVFSAGIGGPAQVQGTNL